MLQQAAEALQRGLQPLTSRLENAVREPEAEGDTQLAHNKEPGSTARCRPPGGFGNAERSGRGFGAPQPITRGRRSWGRGLVPAASVARLGPSIPRLRTRPARTWRASGPPREALCCFFWPRRGSRRCREAWLRAARVSSRGSHGRGGPERASQRPKMARGRGRGARAPRPAGGLDPCGSWSAGPGRDPEAAPLPCPLCAGDLPYPRGGDLGFEALLCHLPDRGPLPCPTLVPGPGPCQKAGRCLGSGSP